MSADLEGVTETSCNFGVMNLRNTADGKKAFDACLLVRSLVDSAVEHLACVAKSAFSLIQADVKLENGYPGWRPDPKAGLLKHFLTVHTNVMGHKANVKVIHAGLECGIIGAKYPGMEMVSFGPNIPRCPFASRTHGNQTPLGIFGDYLSLLLASTPKDLTSVVFFLSLALSCKGYSAPLGGSFCQTMQKLPKKSFVGLSPKRLIALFNTSFSKTIFIVKA